MQKLMLALILLMACYLPCNTARARTLVRKVRLTPAKALRALQAALWLHNNLPPKKRALIHDEKNYLHKIEELASQARLDESDKYETFAKELTKHGYSPDDLEPVATWTREWEAVVLAYEAIVKNLTKQSLPGYEATYKSLQKQPKTDENRQKQTHILHLVRVAVVSAQNRKAVTTIQAKMKAWYLSNNRTNKPKPIKRASQPPMQPALPFYFVPGIPSPPKEDKKKPSKQPTTPSGGKKK